MRDARRDRNPTRGLPRHLTRASERCTGPARPATEVVAACQFTLSASQTSQQGRAFLASSGNSASDGPGHQVR